MKGGVLLSVWCCGKDFCRGSLMGFGTSRLPMVETGNPAGATGSSGLHPPVGLGDGTPTPGLIGHKVCFPPPHDGGFTPSQ